MKKITIIIILVALFATNIYFKVNGFSVPKVTTKVEQADLKEYQKQKDKTAELKSKLQDPTIILNEFKKVGKVISFEGKANYYKVVNDKLFNKFTLREITIDFKYTYGIGISSLEYLKVNKIEGETLFISIPKNRVQLLYIQQNPDSKIIDGDKMFFVDNLKSSETQEISTIVQQNVVNKIGADKKSFSEANANLREFVKELVLKFGYKQVFFTEDLV